MTARPLRDLPPIGRAAVYAGISISALLCILPALLSFFLKAGFLDLANEVLAYRFFYSERIFSGELVIVGVGYLISLLHHATYIFVQFLYPLQTTDLLLRLDAFALLTNCIISLALCALFVVALRSRILCWVDIALLGTLPLVFFYATGGWGFEYALLADYTFLNIFLCIASLLLFQVYWRKRAIPTLTEIVLLGVYVGLAMANKISMAAIAGIVLMPALFASGINWKVIPLRISLVAMAAVLTFISIHLISYLGNWTMMAKGLKVWWWFVRNAGAMPAFWEEFAAAMKVFNYDFLFMYVVIVFILSGVNFLGRRENRARNLAVYFYCLLGIFACIFFIYARPATSTLFESSIFGFTFSMVLLTMMVEWHGIKLVLVTTWAALGLLVVTTFPLHNSYQLIAESRGMSEIKSRAFREAIAIGENRPIEVIFPDNSYHHEGMFELLLKAASDFPSNWHFGSGQRAVLNRYASQMEFRSDGGVLKPSDAYKPGRALVWFDRPDSLPLAAQYPTLAKAIELPGVRFFHWNIPVNRSLIYPHAGQSVKMNLAILPD